LVIGFRDEIPGFGKSPISLLTYLFDEEEFFKILKG